MNLGDLGNGPLRTTKPHSNELLTEYSMQVRTHSRYACDGKNCALHKPSNHHMKNWPQLLRTDPLFFPLIERLCTHNIGHPDPDSVNFLAKKSLAEGKTRNWKKHDCDGCCKAPKTLPKMKKNP